MPKAKSKQLATVEETVENIEAETIPKKENSFKARGGILNEKIGFDSFLFFLAQNYLKGEKIKAGALVRLTELNSYVVARYLERAVVLAVHNRLKEPLADDFVRHRENSGITFNAYVADISNSSMPNPEISSVPYTDHWLVPEHTAIKYLIQLRIFSNYPVFESQKLFVCSKLFPN